MQRKTIPFSEKQMVNLRYVAIDEMESFLDGYTEVFDSGSQAYYHHIDHCQILPENENGLHPVVVIFHSVYLHKG